MLLLYIAGRRMEPVLSRIRWVGALPFGQARRFGYLEVSLGIHGGRDQGLRRVGIRRRQFAVSRIPARWRRRRWWRVPVCCFGFGGGAGIGLVVHLHLLVVHLGQELLLPAVLLSAAIHHNYVVIIV